MFDDFDMSLLEDSCFKEDSVREVLLVPILKRLGYKESGDHKILRSKSLNHPFVRLGVQKFKINIVPDYILSYKDNHLVVVEAKSPKEDILKNGAHIEQAYSYAIHPEVRAEKYCLFNGRYLVIYSVSKYEPVLIVKIDDIEKKWKLIEKELLPKYIIDPNLKDYVPDLGLSLMKAGAPEGLALTFFPFRVMDISKTSDVLYTTFSCLDSEDGGIGVSLDYNEEQLEIILSKLDSAVSSAVRRQLSHAPFQAVIQPEFCLDIDIECRLGELVHGLDEDFVPCVLSKIY